MLAQQDGARYHRVADGIIFVLFFILCGGRTLQ